MRIGQFGKMLVNLDSPEYNFFHRSVCLEHCIYSTHLFSVIHDYGGQGGLKVQTSCVVTFAFVQHKFLRMVEAMSFFPRTVRISVLLDETMSAHLT